MEAALKHIGFTTHGVSDEARSTMMSNMFGNMGQRSGEVSEIPEDPNWRAPWHLHEGIIPQKWFIKKPYPDCRASQLWGWRTNLQNNCKMGNETRVREICAQHSVEEIEEFSNMRLLLKQAAHEGKLGVCKALVEVGRSYVNGVGDRRNKREWMKVQQQSGNEGISKGTTPVFLASEGGHAHVVDYLVSVGADINLPNDHGMTPLHVAVARLHKDIVIKLCKYGADDSAADKTGITPLMLAQTLVTPEYGCPNPKAAQKIADLLVRDSSSGRPLAALLTEDACGHCHSSGCKFSCTCKKVKYCSKECQKAAWKSHKPYHS